MVLAIGLVSGCAPIPPGGGDGPIPVTTMLQGGIRIDWSPDDDGQVNGYEVQVSTEGTGWSIFAVTAEPTATFTEVTPRTIFRFRVRSVQDPGESHNPWGPAVSALYVVPTLPIVRIETDGRTPIVDKELRLPGTIEIDPNGSEFQPYSGSIEINGRGNSTWTLNKKPYRLRLESASELMGMPSNRHWVLLANAIDKSQLRTFAAGELSRATDLAWTPRFRHVEVVLNGEYVGVYQLGEHIRPGSNRVAIDELEPEDVSGDAVTGGYLLERDGYMDQTGDPGFRTPRNEPIVIKEPDPAQPEQLAYIRSYVSSFENALFAKDFTDPATGYRAYLEVDSFIDWHLVQEVTRNHDSFFSSTYFYKQRGEKLRFGPVWDFDQSMGTSYDSLPGPEGWLARDRGAWTRRMFLDPAFVERVGQRWNELQPAFAQVPERVEQLGEELAPAIANDATRWWFTPTPTNDPSYLRNWLDTRIAWMDDQFNAPVG